MVVVQPTKKGEKMWTDNLRHFHFWCQKTLPLVYDDSLSYYEVLAKVTGHLNELTTLVNEIGDELERYEGVTDERLDALETWKSTIDTWKIEIDSWKAIVDTWRENVDGWKDSIDLWKTSIENWQTSINSWKYIVDNTLEIIDERLDTAESDINNIDTVLNSEYTYLGTVNYNSTDDRVYITLNTSTSCDKLQTLVDFEVKSDIARLTHKPVFYLTFSSDVIAHFENESYPVDSRVYFQDLNADVFSYMKQGSNDIILDGLAIVMSDYNTLKTVKSGVTYRAFYIGNGLYYSFENVGTDIENRLIGVEDDITSLDGRVDDAEDGINLINNQSYYIVQAYVQYDTTNSKWALDIGKELNEPIIQFIINGLSNSVTPRSLWNGTWKPYIIYLIDFPESGYDGSGLYLRVGRQISTKQYVTVDGADVVLPLSTNNANTPFSLTGGLIVKSNVGSNYSTLNDRFQYRLPTGQTADNGKLLSYNAITNEYELVTPGGGSSHTYSTTPQVIGKWTDGTTDVYEITYINQTINVGTGGSQTIDTNTNIDKLIGVEGAIVEAGKYYSLGYSWGVLLYNNNIIFAASGNNSFANATLNLTIRYTKVSTP